MFDAGQAKITITAEDQASKVLDQVKGKIAETQSFTDKYSATIKKVGNIADKTAKATAGAIAFVAKKAIENYGQYEQLAGGVEKLFGDSAKIVQKNADKAFKTANLSANKYMELTTTFSASLIQGLGGDTKKAAKIADVAIKDMTDNVNTFGSKQEEVQNAYRGFAKQNFTMLDNLKLGYGGTKTEMERLLKDAEKLTGKKYNLNNFADIVEAIHAIQEEYNITGTTAKEAAHTIEGSVNTMKAAWDNWLTALGSGSSKRIQKTTTELTDSIKNVGKNVIPVLGNVLKSLKPLMALLGSAVLVKFTSKLLLAENAVRKFQAANAGMSITQGVLQGKLSASEGIIGSFGKKVNATSLLLKAMPWAAAAAGAAALGYAIYEAYKSTHKYRNEVDDLAKSNENRIKSIEKNAESAEFLTNKIEELSKVEHKTNGEKNLMASYVERLNELYPNLNLQYDKEKDKLNKTTDEIYKYIDAKREEAKAAAYQKNFNKAIEEQIKLEQKRNDAFQEYKRAKEQYDNEAASGYVSQKTSQNLQEAKSNLKDVREAYVASTKEATKWNNESVKASGRWKELTKEARKAGIDIPKSVKDGIKSGEYVIPESINDLQKLIEFDNLSKKVGATAEGKKLVEKLGQGVRDGKVSLDEAVKELKLQADVKADTKPAKKDIKNLNKEKVKEKTLKVNGDKKKADKAIKDVNKDKIKDKTLKVGGDKSKADKAISSVNKSKVKDKKTTISATDNATSKINSINNKKIKNKKFSISAVLTGLNAKVKRFLGLRRGTREIPYDGYVAELHKGERVLTAPEVNQYESIMREIGDKALKAQESKQIISMGIDYDRLAKTMVKALGNVDMTSTIQVDGRTLAQTTAPFMSEEINKIDYRANRKLGYV